MKKAFLLLLAMAALWPAAAQKIDESTIKRFSIGADFFTDIWLDKPDSMDIRAINQGVNVFGMYNFPFGESNVSFAIGLGLGFHNLYSDTRIENFRADTILFVPINDTIDYRKSKLGLSFFDIPLEIRLKTEKKFRFAVGFKIGYLMDGKTKYKAEGEDGKPYIIKEKQVAQLEKWRFGPTIRIGYDWINVMGYFNVTQIFKRDRGPDLYPISVGITLLPF
jgi:hypothetical protein